MNQKIKKLRELIKSKNLDGLIIYNPVNIQYLTGLKIEGIFIINDVDNILITNNLYIEEVRNNITIDDEILIQEISELSKEELLTIFQNCKTVGFEENYVTYANYRNMLMKFRIKEPVESNYIVERMREVKDEEEISYIEKACNITDSCFLHIQDYIKIGMTEKQVAYEIGRFFIENGADGLAFDTIVASGVNSSKPHAIPTDKRIDYGDAIVIDFGAKYKGYCADMTRTIFAGNASEKQREVYNIVMNSQNRALSKMKNNADIKEISDGVKNEFGCYNYDLVHALGHGVGLDIHERPLFGGNQSCFLKANMVITNEPGIYIPGEFGVRIEDTLVVNNLEPTVLTKSNKNLLII